MNNTCDLKTLSELLNISARRIQQLANEGTVHKASRGKYDLTRSVQGYITYLNDQIPNKANGDTNTDSRSVTEMGRAVLMTEKAKMAKIERREMEGGLKPAEEVRKEAYSAAVNVRRAMLTLPDRLSPVLVNMSDSREIRSFLRRELTAGLTDVSAEIERGELVMSKTEILDLVELAKSKPEEVAE